jgi:hypothetical protein
VESVPRPLPLPGLRARRGRAARLHCCRGGAGCRLPRLGRGGLPEWPRDTYLGWDLATKRARLHLVAQNTRFLLLPWVRVPHLASKVLAANLRRLSADWQARYGHGLLLAETFVDPARFRGTCYRAANWVCLGPTQGAGKRGNRYRRHGVPKLVFVYPLHARARERLAAP